MTFSVLGSGSKGNSIAVWEDDRGLLIDVGLGYKKTIERLESIGVDPKIFDRALITHAHGDHVRALKTWQRNHRLVLHATAATLAELDYHDTRPIALRELTDINSFAVYAVPVIHNSAGACTYMIESPSGARLATILETGHITKEIFRAARHSHAYIVEANHDRHMCVLNPDRPQRINERTLLTHLSNDQAAEFVKFVDVTAETVVLFHLSGDNNHPEQALEVCQTANDQRRKPVKLIVSSQDEPTEPIKVTP